MDIGKILMIIGLIIVALGFFMNVSDKIPFLGKLPGDIYYKKDGFTFYFPLTTSILISVLLSLILRLFNR